MNINFKKTISIITAAATIATAGAVLPLATYAADNTATVAGAATTSSITATAISGSKIRVSWTPVSGAAGYVLYQAKDGDAQYTAVGSSEVTTHVFDGFTAGTAIHFTVRPYFITDGAYSYGGFSDAATAVPESTAVRGLLASAEGTDKVNVTWGAVNGATFYNVYFATSTSTEWKVVGTPETTSFTSTNLAANSAYSYYVTPVFNGVEGTPSNAVTATTQSKAPVNNSGGYNSPTYNYSLRGVVGTWVANGFNVNGATKIVISANGTASVDDKAAERYYAYVLDNGDRDVSVSINGKRVNLRYSVIANKLYYGNSAMVRR